MGAKPVKRWTDKCRPRVLRFGAIVMALAMVMGCENTEGSWNPDAAFQVDSGVTDALFVSPVVDADEPKPDSIGTDKGADAGSSADLLEAGPPDASSDAFPFVEQWLSTVGGPSAKLSITDADFDSFGNSTITGCLSGSVNFGSTALAAQAQSDPFVAVISSTGKVVQAFSFKSSGHSCGHAIVRNATGDFFVAGSYRKDLATTSAKALTAPTTNKDYVFLAKVDSQGTVEWFSSDLGLEGQARGLALDGNGDIYVTGKFAGQGKIGNRSFSSADKGDLFVAKFSSNGVATFSLAIHGAGNSDQGRAINVDSNSNIYITGSVKGPAIHAGAPIVPTGNTHFLVAKFDAQGNALWFRHTEGSQGAGQGNALGLTATGDVIVGGSYSGTTLWGTTTLNPSSTGLGQILISRLSGATGNVLWTTSAESSQGLAASADAVSIKSDGTFCVAGSFMGSALESGALTIPGASAQNARTSFALGFDSGGNASWNLSAWGTSALAGPAFTAIDCSRGKELLVAGTMILENQFGGSRTTTRGVWDMFLWSLLRP
jgi:hypothetical protein